MKKIITLIFFVGFIGAAFAQSGKRQLNGTNNNTYQTSQNNGNNNTYSNPYATNNAYNKTTQWNNYNNNADQYLINRDGDDGDRDGNRKSPYYQEQYHNQRMQNYYWNRTKHNNHEMNDRSRW